MAETNRAILQSVVTFRDAGAPKCGWTTDWLIEVPALFVRGAKDQLAPADVARDLAERMSDANPPLSRMRITSHTSTSQTLWSTAINGLLRHPASQ
jgi:pimeloyl-ACP methyl ester carboxylesterase